jgi:hypothetical protein
MRKIKRRWIVLGSGLLAAVGVPAVLWLSLTHRPKFYQAMAEIPRERRQSGARRFVAQSLQLRNDIVNEPRWEAAFTDEEVNAWLAEDLVTHFADQIPPGVHEPRIAFELGRVTLGFELEEGPVRSVITVVARVNVPEENTLALTLESIRAGLLPVPAERITERITQQARGHGLDIRWERDGELPMAVLHYAPHPQRNDVILESLQVLEGQIHLKGRSSRAVASPTLPTRRVLQSTFPRRKTQPKDGSPPPMS